MHSEKDHLIYTAEDIQKYLSGRLTPSEMHTMEKAALDDAFLAEAMEGYSGMEQTDWKTQLEILKNDFSKKDDTRVVMLRPATRVGIWKIAAAVFVIFAGAGVAYLLTHKDLSRARSVASVVNPSDSIKKEITSPVATDTNNKMIADNTIAVKKMKDPQPVIPDRARQLATDSPFIYRPGKADHPVRQKDADGGAVDDSIQSMPDIATSNVAAAPKENNLEFKNNQSAGVKTIDPGYTDKSTKTLNTNSEPVILKRFSAQVVDKEGNPLPFANVNIIKENIGTYADAKGNFRLVSGDSILNIEIKSVGYVTRNFTLSNGAMQNKIILSEDEFALKEKTAISDKSFYAAPGKKRRSILIPDSVINAEPEDGWNNYDTYITNNLFVPGDISKKKIHGEVEVSFDVQSDGALTNVKIDKSLCGNCDEAALRAVKQGPRWKVKKGNQSTGKVKVKF